MEALIDIKRASEVLGIKIPTLYQWVHMKDSRGRSFIPHLKLGGRLRFRVSDLEAWIAKRKNPGRDSIRAEI